MNAMQQAVLENIPSATTHLVATTALAWKDSRGQKTILTAKVCTRQHQNIYCSVAFQQQLHITILMITDVDECKMEHVCNTTTEICENTFGAYTCKCRYGYENKTQCEGMYTNFMLIIISNYN